MQYVEYYIGDGETVLVTPEDKELLEHDKLAYGQFWIAQTSEGIGKRIDPATVHTHVINR